jgi:acyl-coenzyme A synthetase/AMP-(fatty) acid ligase
MPDSGSRSLTRVSSTLSWSRRSDWLLSALRETLAGFKIPRGVTFAADLPRTPSGKVRKQDLPRP